MSVVSKLAGFASRLLLEASGGREDLSNITPYRYSPLPGARCVRLLEIYRGIGDLSCSLVTASLDDNIEYDALSYTWGDPRPPLFHVINPQQWERRHPIKCSGATILVAENLLQGLLRLRSFMEEDGSALQRFVWVDAICINQNDTAERSSQVTMMGDIYANAKTVVAWLGKHDAYTERALQLIGYLSAIPQEDYQRYKGLELSQAHPGIPETDWNALAAFFKRSYFSRVWIVQELALAYGVIFLCGSFTTTLEALFNCSTYFIYTQSSKYLTLRHSLFASISDRMQKKTIRPVGYELSVISKIRSSLGSGHISARYVMEIGRAWNATDPRDNVFAMYGLAERMLQGSSTELTVRPKSPDYSKTVAQVYVEYAEYILATSQNLQLLSSVEDKSHRSAELSDSLPSWVPDQSVLMVPTPLQIIWLGHRYMKWDPIGGDSGGTGIGVPIDGRVLLVAGAYFDTIVSVPPPLSNPENQFNWVDILDHLRPVWAVSVSSTSFADALWRTVISDTQLPSHEHPAPPEIGRAFGELLVSRLSLMQVAHLDPFEVKQLHLVNQELMGAIASSVRENPSTAGHSLMGAASPVTSMIMKETKRISESRKSQDHYTALANRTVQTLNELSKHDDSGVFLKPEEINQVIGPRANSDAGNRLWTRAEAFRASMTSVCTQRRLLLTTGNYLGIGPASMREGDQVWILRGAKVPFILRPQVDGQFCLVGEAYVHGIMHGEAAVNSGLKFRDIEIA